MVYPDSHFVGRSWELAEIHQCLSGSGNKMFLVGMGGIGKSEIARMSIKQHQADYDVILWVPFETSWEQTINNDCTFPIQGLSRNEFPEDTDQDYFQRKLRVLKEIADRRIHPEKMAALLESGAANMAKENIRAADMIFGQLKEVSHLSTLSEDEQYLLNNVLGSTKQGTWVAALREVQE